MSKVLVFVTRIVVRDRVYAIQNYKSIFLQSRIHLRSSLHDFKTVTDFQTSLVFLYCMQTYNNNYLNISYIQQNYVYGKV